jgi:hypothetical protein
LGRIPLQRGTARARTGIEETGDVTAARQRVRDGSGFALVRVARLADGWASTVHLCGGSADAIRPYAAIPTLLDGVSQLVRQQFITLCRTRLELAFIEKDILSVGEGLGPDGLIHLPGIAADMDTHCAEIGTKPWLHVGAHRVRQGTAASFAQADLGFDIGSCLKAIGQ